ncbi:efflux RND transporter periplasmic adaptor subunit [Methylibium rhizosphaerae]|uniref:efflux RND transporter periplasmic adaptor subunit n=1 Tax=Methylibium rhizosphaerae TaxID=2570323 RepID=UPI0011276301|nr:efflux RND transporter periplasmic adaptor subunit [Methylibium rhizosphaerae]
MNARHPNAARAMLRSATLAVALLGPQAAFVAAAPALVTAAVESDAAAGRAGFDGVVEAVRQTAVAAQVAGAIVGIDVKVGDTVKAGQVLVRLDARAAEQTAAAGAAQVQAARAALEVAASEFDRQKQLFAQQYISQAALDRAAAQLKATQAETQAQLAQAGAARTRWGLHVVKAPYAGVVAELPVTLGDMALPGRLLASLYDPASLRITAAVPQSAVAGLGDTSGVRLELPGLPAERRWLAAAAVQVLPTADPGTHTVPLRLMLPPGIQGVSPGMFARAWLPVRAAGGARLFIPAQAIVRRAEMTGVYVVDASGRALLRQVRLGPSANGRTEVLAGLSAGQRVALEPQAAVRLP